MASLSDLSTLLMVDCRKRRIPVRAAKRSR